MATLTRAVEAYRGGPVLSIEPEGSIRAIETEWIVLSDGTRLAARLWLPPDAERTPAPAILEYLPYRRRDRHRVDDSLTHPGLAARGYATVRVDMRGSGDSDGLVRDEYTHGEWRDGLEVIAWMARQPWCSGAVGMIGLSWSGFNALQIAALRPPALKAIVTVCASDDRFADDMHYMGGCLLNDNLQYGATFFTWLATPPDPEIVGERWRQMWLDRLEAVTPRAAEWMSHPTRDAYWRSGSVAVDYPRIEAAVLAVGGWADGYVNAALRLMEGLAGPRKAVIGPWGHAFPHVATPGPRIDFLGLVVRWMDRWLKGIDNGVMDEPMVTVWRQESEAPLPSFAARKGGWIAEARWPSPGVEPLILALQGGRIGGGLQPAAPLIVCSPATTGIASGEWCPYGWGPDMATDQRGDDACSAVFDGEALEAELTLLGGTVVTLDLSVDTPEAMIAVRLCDVSPDGVSRRIAYGLRNLGLCDDLAAAREIVPGEAMRVAVRLKDTCYRVPAGHHLRVAVSTVYWPLAVPAPAPVTATILSGEAALPVRIGQGVAPPDLGQAVIPAAMPVEVHVPPRRGRQTITTDVAAGRTSVEVVRNLGSMTIPEVGITVSGLGREIYETVECDPRRTRSTAFREASFRRGGWEATVRTRSVLSFAGVDYVLASDIEACEGETRVFARSWTDRIPRLAARR